MTRHWDLQKLLPKAQQHLLHPTFAMAGHLKYLVDAGWLFVCLETSNAAHCLCWIPMDRRPGCMQAIAWQGAIVAIGSDKGVVTILDCSDALSRLGLEGLDVEDWSS